MFVKDRIFLQKVPESWDIFSQNSRHKLKIGHNKNVLKCVYLKWTGSNIHIFKQRSMCNIFVCISNVLYYFVAGLNWNYVNMCRPDRHSEYPISIIKSKTALIKIDATLFLHLNIIYSMANVIINNIYI